MWDGKIKTPFVTPLTLPTTLMCRRLLFPASIEFSQLVNGALAELIKPKNFTETEGGLTVAETIAAFNEMFSEYLKGCSSMVGQIVTLATLLLPEDMLWCDGATYNRVDYPELYGVIDNAFILTADTFKTPDLVGKFPLGVSGSHAIGTGGGLENVTLSTAEIPSHTHVQNSHDHSVQPHNHSQTNHMHGLTPHTHTFGVRNTATGFGTGQVARGNQNTANSSVTVDANDAAYTDLAPAIILDTVVNIDVATATNQNTGGGGSHTNMPPFLTIKYAIVAR